MTNPSPFSPKDISIEVYDYQLPDDRVAKYPLKERDSSKLLLYNGCGIATHRFKALPTLLPEHSLLVMNDTKVIHARLEFFRATGGRIEVFCLEPVAPALYEKAIAAEKECRWKCLIGNARKWKEGEVLSLPIYEEGVLTAKRVGDSNVVDFSWDAPLTFGEVLTRLGELPIPPYLHRKSEPSDLATYQTVYALHEGSVAAPTAGLHFTPALLADLEKQGHSTTQLTLHVGAGTFLPVKSDTMAGHEMHRETIAVPYDTLSQLLQSIQEQRPIVAVGTTSTRTLESLYYMGVQLLQGASNPFVVSQWTPYETEPTFSTEEALQALLHHLESSDLDTLIGATQLIIVPGFRFRIISALITNFHQPKSTLLLLVSAFLGGEEWRKVYRYALDEGYRFLSYGDGSLLIPKKHR